MREGGNVKGEIGDRVGIWGDFRERGRSEGNVKLDRYICSCNFLGS